MEYRIIGETSWQTRVFVEDIVKIMEPVMNDLVKGEPKNEIIVCQPNETMRLRCSCAMEAFG